MAPLHCVECEKLIGDFDPCYLLRLNFGLSPAKTYASRVVCTNLSCVANRAQKLVRSAIEDNLSWFRIHVQRWVIAKLVLPPKPGTDEEIQPACPALPSLAEFLSEIRKSCGSSVATRISTLCYYEHINTVEGLTHLTRNQVLGRRNFGAVSYDCLVQGLARHGLSLRTPSD